jgi:hypothetical protein
VAALAMGFAAGRVTAPQQPTASDLAQAPASRTLEETSRESVQEPAELAQASADRIPRPVASVPLNQPPRLSEELLQAMLAQARPIRSRSEETPPPFLLPSEGGKVIDLRTLEYH